MFVSSPSSTGLFSRRDMHLGEDIHTHTECCDCVKVEHKKIRWIQDLYSMRKYLNP